MLAETRRGASLELPADAAFMATARIFSSSLARHFAANEDRVEDVKLAISEACAAFIRTGTEATIRVEVEPGDGCLRFEVSGPPLPPIPHDDDTPATPSDFAARTGSELIRALFEGSEIVTDGQRSTVRFAVPLGAAEG
ncbi:MAG: ATP-binding protein [Actinomycetota bacterium]